MRTDFRKYEIQFLIVTILIVTLMNNFPYYSLYLFPSEKYKSPDFTVFEILSKVTWYTLQSMVSILIMVLYNYFWSGFLLPDKARKFNRILLLILYNLILTALLYYFSIFFAGITVGYPFGKDASYMFYLWRFFYLTPLAILIAYILRINVKNREIEINNAKLVKEKLSNELKMLKDQLQPHFLFNTLNTLSSIIRNESKDEGLQYVSDLAFVYRYILDNSKYDKVTLSTEHGFASSYFRLLEKRYHNGLLYKINIPNELQNNEIPPLTLLLLIENIIKHNEISKSKPITVTIFIERDKLVVENNIVLKKEGVSGLGIGLHNLNQRYVLLTKNEITIREIDDKFRVELPLIK